MKHDKDNRKLRIGRYTANRKEMRKIVIVIIISTIIVIIIVIAND